ncbi:MAG TPA: cytochrome c oxidase assembly protein [Burkholderiales bacterium]|nr:cytochrome c oxidase assembly protein [Burkholderiales bacterium]
MPWTFEWLVVACLLIAALLYLAGAWKLWRKAGVGRGLTLTHAGAFTAGWLTLVVALASPLDALGARLFSAHMVQHELLMVVAAPLFVLSRPLEAWTWGLPPAWRGAAGRVAHWRPLQLMWGTVTAAFPAWAIHAAALWLWHVPAFFNAALSSEGMHILQHASFLASALLFWWAALGRTGERSPALAIALLFTTMLHTGALGALLTFSTSPWYRAYGNTGDFGLAAIEDQQLGGLIMWIPGGVAYLASGLAIVFRHYLAAAADGARPPRPALSGDQVPRPHRPQ